MKDKKEWSLALVTTIACLLPMVLAAILYKDLPETMPVHFNSAGEADGFASKAVACFGLPGFLALINLLVHFGLNADPKKKNAKGVVRSAGLLMIPVISIIVCPITFYMSMGYEAPIQIVIPALLGVLFLFIGNYLPKCKQNYTVGIKLPWTLNNEDNWNKTHRLAGFIWIIGGIVFIASAFVGEAFKYVFFPCIIAMVFVPMICSYILYRKGM